MPDDQSLNLVNLRNGGYEHESVVEKVTSALKELIEPKPDVLDVLALYEVVTKARNAEHVFFSEEIVQRLHALGLVTQEGVLCKQTACVIQATVIGEGASMRLQNPRLLRRRTTPIP